MKKNAIFFIASLILVVCTGFCCIPNFVSKFSPNNSFLSPSSAMAKSVDISEDNIQTVFENQKEISNIYNVQAEVQQKNTFKLRGITKKLLLILLFILIVPVAASIFIVKKFNLMVKQVSNGESDLQNAIDKLNELQEKFKDTFDVNEIGTQSDKITKEINDFLENFSQEELDSIEIKPVTEQKEELKKYTQKEKSYAKPQLHEPILINSQPISKTKGFYLVDCGRDKALFGYINNDIFLLNKFNHIQNKNIQVRLTEKIGHKNIYIVKNGTYKALVQVEKEKMKVLLEM